MNAIIFWVAEVTTFSVKCVSCHLVVKYFHSTCEREKEKKKI